MIVPIPGWAIPAAMCGTVVLTAAAGLTGYTHGREVEQGKQALAEQAVASAAKEVAAVLSAEVAKLRPINRTINKAVEVRTNEIPVYRDCVHDDSVYDSILRAYGKRPAGGQPVPADRPAGGQVLQGDHTSPD